MRGKKEQFNSILEDIEPNYKALVDETFSNSSSNLLENSNLTHASYLIFKLIQASQKTINGISECFIKECWDHPLITKELEKKLQNGVKVRFVSKKNVHPHSKIKELAEKYPEKMVLKEKFPDLTNHFLVVDANKFRYEIEHNEKEKSFRAKVSANNPRIAKKLNKLFNLIFNEKENV